MFAALCYLQFQSFKNRLWQRVRRLRNPRYLFGALIGLAYFVLVFGRSLYRTGGTLSRPGVLPTLPPGTLEFVASLALFVLLLLAWLIPHARAALVFSEAEIAFLFPAPVRRRTLIHYKLVRSQVAVLFTVFFLTLLSRWSGGLGGALLRAAGWWLLLSTTNLHLLGSSFARTMLLERGVTVWQRRTIVLALVGVLVAGAAVWIRAQMPPASEYNFQTFGGYTAYVQDLAQTGPAVYLLAPFRWIVRPFLASDNVHTFLAALGPAVAMLALHYLWVVRADVAFEEASLEASRRHIVRATAVREGRGLAARPHKRRRAPFRLAPTGPPSIALLWKNLLSAGQVFSARFALVLLCWSGFVGFTLGRSAGGQHVLSQVIAYMAFILAIWSILLGPQVMRQDFRQDLAVADLIKVYPLRGWQVALGELLTPAVILTLIQWVFILLACTLWDKRVAEDDPSAWGTHGAWAASAAILVLPLNFVSLVVPNAAALLFPAWFATPTTPGASRGIEVIGQRFIFIIGQFFALFLAALPVALTLFLTYILLTEPVLGHPWALPVASVAAAVVCAAEAVGGLFLLGHWFESYDLSAEKLT